MGSRSQNAHPIRQPSTILQWNCRSLRLKKNELVRRLRDRPVPILAFCEGSLPKAETMPGFLKYCTPFLPQFPHGSAGLYVQQDLPQYKVDTSSLPSEGYACVAVDITVGNRTLRVACIYIHLSRSYSTTGIIEGFPLLAKGSLVVCGDMNAHHPRWGSAKTCRRGLKLSDEIETAGLVVANNGSPTFLIGHSTVSCIYVTPHTPDLPVIWRTDSSTEGSDHFPIHIAIEGYGRLPRLGNGMALVMSAAENI